MNTERSTLVVTHQQSACHFLPNVNSSLRFHDFKPFMEEPITVPHNGLEQIPFYLPMPIYSHMS